MTFRLASLPQIIQQFLKDHAKNQGPFLLGYSGGPDSKALLYSLLECGIKQLHLAHVDHGWRPESAQEAADLRLEADKLHCPFHTIRLTKTKQGNSEDQARRARLEFFHSLFSQMPFEALLLAHQGDDLAETVLKRILEGAQLSHLGGMEPVSSRDGMVIWRPLLEVRKRDVFHFLEERNLTAIRDVTNSDPRYLRARMRENILPSLEQAFGKGIIENLMVLSKRASELKTYLDAQLDLRRVHRGPWGVWLEMKGLKRVEQAHLLQKIAKEESIQLTRAVLDALLNWTEKNLANRRLRVQLREIVVDRGHLFMLSKQAPVFANSLKLGLGQFRSGDWRIQVERTEETLTAVDWKQVWMGQFIVGLEEGEYLLQSGGASPSLRKFWNQKKVPSFLRDCVPLAWKGGEIVKEFLSGSLEKGDKAKWKVSFSCSVTGLY